MKLRAVGGCVAFGVGVSPLVLIEKMAIGGVIAPPATADAGATGRLADAEVAAATEEEEGAAIMRAGTAATTAAAAAGNCESGAVTVLSDDDDDVGAAGAAATLEASSGA